MSITIATFVDPSFSAFVPFVFYLSFLLDEIVLLLPQHLSLAL